MPLVRVKKGDKYVTKIGENEKKLAKEYIKNGFNKRQAALKTYHVKPQNASNLANQVLKRPQVQSYVSELLTKSGVGLEELSDYTSEIIAYNLRGKPSQAVAAGMIQYAYKLHNAVPVTRSITGRVDLGSTGVTQKDFQEVKKILSELNERSKVLLDES